MLTSRATRLTGATGEIEQVALAPPARVFDVDPGPMQRAEAGSWSAFRSIGVVGGPFPWWDALGLTWPGPDAGELVSAG